VRVLIENSRIGVLPEVRDLFVELKHEREGVVDAEIASAFPLDDTQLTALVSDLEARFKRKVQPQVAIDQDLIGGVKVVVGDEVIDGSVRGKLAAMAAALAKV
jgi:F-type H+-transporting ATPase subunit delta